MKTSMLALLATSAAISSIAYDTAMAGSIEGDVYVVNAAGDIKKGAANVVHLIPDSPSLASDWHEMCERHGSARDELSAKLEAKKAELRQRIDETSGREKEHARMDLRTHRESYIFNLNELLKNQINERDSWIKDKVTSASQTGMHAHYSFNLESGRYWLYASLPLGDRSYEWIVSVEIEGDERKSIDLDNSNLLQQGTSCESNPFYE